MNIVNVRFGIHDTLTSEQEELKNEIAMSKYKRTKSGIYTDGNFKWYSCGGEPFRFVREYEEFDYGQPSFRYEDVIAVGDTIGELFINKTKNIVQLYTIKQEPKQLSDLIYEIQEKYISHCVASFDEFCIDELYKHYQQLGFTKVLVINRTEFKKFILWALPLWNKYHEQEIEFDESQILKAPFIKDAGVKDYIPTKYEKVIHDCINLLKQEGSDTKQQVLEKLEELIK